MRIKTVPSTWMNRNALRLDSSPYLSGAFELRVRLETMNVKKLPLKDLTLGGEDGIIHAGRTKRVYVNDPDYGVPFLGTSSMLATELSNLPYISNKVTKDNPSLLIQKDWILITRSGTIGRIVFARPDMDGLAFSEDVMRIVADPSKIYPGYLYAFLSTDYGIPLILEGTYGAIIRHIEPYHITDLPVPILPDSLQKVVHDKIIKMANLRAEASNGYFEATNILMDTVGVTEPTRSEWIEDTRKLGYVTTNVDSKSLRALNYHPLYEDLIDTISKGNTDPLGSLCEPDHFKSGIIFKRIDADPEFAVRLIGQRDSFRVRPEGRWISEESIEGLGLLVPPGTTLIAAHGTLGETEQYCRSVFATNRTSEYAFSGDFVRCIPLQDKILPGYLFAFLRSETAFRILRSISTGSKQQAPHPDLLWNIPVPRLDPSVEQEIHEIIQDSADKFDESLRLEEEAWQLVESWITEHSS